MGVAATQLHSLEHSGGVWPARVDKRTGSQLPQASGICFTHLRSELSSHIMDATPLIVGLNVADVSIGQSKSPLDHSQAASGSSSHAVHRAFASSSTTFVATWTIENSSSHQMATAVGCEDGSCYVFRPPRPKEQHVASPISPSVLAPKPQLSPNKVNPASPITSRHLKSPSPTPSRSSWSTSLHVHSHPPSIIAPRTSLSTAGLSKAQVEAPKNFVDYDDEADHLREMLKTNRTDVGGTRRTSLTTTASRSSTPSTVVEDVLSPTRESVSHLTSLETAQGHPSAVFPGSSKNEIPPLELQMRILPPRSGNGHAVVSIKALERGTLIACLQESGCVLRIVRALRCHPNCVLLSQGHYRCSLLAMVAASHRRGLRSFPVYVRPWGGKPFPKRRVTTRGRICESRRTERFVA